MKLKILLLLTICSISLSLFVPAGRAENLSDWRGVLEKGAFNMGYNTDDVSSPDNVISIVIKAFLSFLGVLFLILMIYGGFLWMTARGNEAQVTKSKDLMTAAVIGLIIVLLSYAISNFVISSLGKETLSI